MTIDQPEHERALRLSERLRPWAKPVLGTLITLAIFVWMFKPVVRRWADVHQRITHTSPLRFVLAAAMFAAFLFVFRVFSWRYILSIWKHPLPIPASARIWSTSELARYLPGVIWQVVGRVYLCRPYGVSGVACSASQVLELIIFLLANLIVALACLPWFAAQLPHEVRQWFYLAWALVPLLLMLLYPPLFYGIADKVMAMLNKPAIKLRMDGKHLAILLIWAILGLVWQGIAIWVLLGQPSALGLSFSRLGLVLGSYSLAWCAGFLAIWAPGGIGPRELVLALSLRLALPPAIAQQFPDKAAFDGFLAFLAVLLRLWTVAGEIILVTFAYLSDYRGAMGRPDAPGRQRLMTLT